MPKSDPPLAAVLPFPVVDHGRVWRLASVPAFAGAALVVFAPPLGLACFALALGVLWFHRDPDRTASEPGFLSPADGTVSVIREEGDRLRVGVFMNVDDVHVNRAPMGGTVTDVRHRPGAYKPAFSKDSDRNEQLVFDLGEYEVCLIAGWFARRIHPHVDAGDDVERGDRIGHVSFGSRADVVFPPEVDRSDLRVGVGEVVRAGETVIADGTDLADH